MADEKPEMVKVACKIPNGIELRLFKQGFDDGTGQRPLIHDQTKPRVFLAGPNTLGAGVGNTMVETAPAVHSDVDAEYFAEWLKQNEKNPLVTKGFIVQVDKEREEREAK